jgi:hypothetical protein
MSAAFLAVLAVLQDSSSQCGQSFSDCTVHILCSAYMLQHTIYRAPALFVCELQGAQLPVLFMTHIVSVPSFPTRLCIHPSAAHHLPGSA